MNNTSEEILALITCPICFVHPEKGVFQCQNGHPICSSCISPLLNCPTCQLPFGVPPTRCLLMESLLDIVALHCSNKDAGCTQLFLRKDLPDHHKICEFRPVSLCKWMGFDCDFTASAAVPLINHLESCHNAQKWRSIIWRKFVEIAPFRSLFLQECIGNTNNSGKTWFILLVTLAVEPNGQKLFSCVPIHLHDGHRTLEHEVHLSVSIEHEEKIKNRLLSKWIGYPSSYRDAEEDILYPSLRVTSNHVVKQALKLSQLTEFDLTLRFTVEVNPILANQK